MIREAPTTSSSESIFTDPESPTTILNLTISQLEQLELTSELPRLQIERHEQINFDGGTMPIVKKPSSEENGSDKGIFSVSRVKKVELAEIPLTTTRKFRAGKFLTFCGCGNDSNTARPSLGPAGDFILIKINLL